MYSFTSSANNFIHTSAFNKGHKRNRKGPAALHKTVSWYERTTLEQRLTKLGIHSLEVRRADLIFMCQIVFGLCEGVTRDNLFKMCSVHNHSRGHRYRVYLPVVKSSARYNFFSYRVLNSWNSLPNTTDFSSLAKFKTGLSTRMLLRYCKVCLA